MEHDPMAHEKRINQMQEGGGPRRDRGPR